MISIIIMISWHGHHPAYCTQFIRACGSFSDKIFVICPAEANPMERLGGLAQIAAKTEVLHYSNRYPESNFSKFSFLIEDYRELRQIIGPIVEGVPKSKVFIFHSDLGSFFCNALHLPLVLLCMRALFPWPFSGLLISPDRRWPLEGVRARLEKYFGAAGKSTPPLSLIRKSCDEVLAIVAQLQRKLYLWQRNTALRFSRCDQIAVEDERYIDALRIGTGKRTVYFPETTSEEAADPAPELVRNINSKREGLVVVGLLGAIGPHKGIDLLLDVLRKCKTEDFLFVIAGSCGPDSLKPEQWAYLNDGQHNVIFSPNPINSEQEFNAIVKSCDILYCAYKGHLHSSNVVAKAAAFRKPILVSGGELMAKRVQEYKMGTILGDQTVEACIGALREMGSPEYLREIQKTAKFSKHMEDHSFESLQKVMTTLSAGNLADT